MVIMWVYYTISFGFHLLWYYLDITYQPFTILYLAKDHGFGLSTGNAHMVHIGGSIRFLNDMSILDKVLLVECQLCTIGP